LDPSLSELPPNFEYNPASRECRFTVDSWLFPNSLLFSIRAVKRDDPTNYSLWVSIPVTTIIEQPSMLEAIKDASWDFTLGTRTPMQGLRITIYINHRMI